MLRVPQPSDRVVNRRYTIRSFDATRAAVVIDVSLHGAGPGTDWIRAARIGDRIDAIGPRGKITLHTGAEWHLFIGDETGMPGALAMIEALPSASTAKALLEIDTAADEQESNSHRCSGWTSVGFTDRVVRCRVILRHSSRRLPMSPCPPASVTPTSRPRREWYGASSEIWPNAVSGTIRFRPRRIGDGVCPTPSTGSQRARIDVGDASDPVQAWEVVEAPARWRASGSTGPSRSSPATPDEHSFLLSNGESPVRRHAKTRTVTDQAGDRWA